MGCSERNWKKFVSFQIIRSLKLVVCRSLTFFYMTNIRNDTGTAKFLGFETQQTSVQPCKTLFNGKVSCCSSSDFLITCYF